MGKRTAFEAKAMHGDRNPKRQRANNSYERETHEAAPVEEEVTSARQLQNVLVFQQSSANSLRRGLVVLKRFLDSILYSTEEHDLPRKRAILREYLDTQKEKARDAKETVLLPQLIQGWDFAAETNVEALLTQITAVLALLFKVFAANTEFFPYASLLAKTVLRPTVARRLVRSLSAGTSKEQVILPALRLLTEITRYAEGVFARSVYARKEFTLEPKVLARNISTWQNAEGMTAAELHRKPGLRTTSVRYFLAHLQYQDGRAKADLLSNRDVVRAIVDHLTTDPPFLIADIFRVFTNHVFLDKAIPRNVKSRLLNGKALTHIAGLYRYQAPEGTLLDGEKTPDAIAHDFLRMVCTSPAHGVMLPTEGFYSHAGPDDDGDVPMEDLTGGDLDLDVFDGPIKPRPVRNVVLSDFLQSLRPHAITMHQELVIDTFKACPELIADYFYRRKDFNYDPSLSTTWIGFSAFLYKTIEIPVPATFGASNKSHSRPPPVSSLLMSILPQPLTQQVLVKCLNSSSDLIQLFAVRVMIAAFHKLRAVLQELDRASAASSSQAWANTSRRLTTEFSQRCPSMKSVIVAFRQPAFQKGLKRESITRLLRLYYEVTPEVALEEKFDVSLPLCNALTAVEKLPESSEDMLFCVMELEHWIQMARHSPAMRWWQKTKTLQYSPFTTLMKLVASSPESELYTGIKRLLVAVLRDQEMLQMTTSPDALDGLIASLGTSNGSSTPSVPVLEFVDDCCTRFIKGPIKYFDDLDTLRARNSRASSDFGPFSPLLMTFVEQWPFRGGKPEKGNPAEPLAQWLSKYLYLLKLVGEDEAALAMVRDALVESADSAYKDVLKDSFLWKMGKEKAKEALKLATGADFSGSERSSSSPAPPTQPEPAEQPQNTVDLELPPEEDENHPGLNRWRKKEIEEAVDDGDIGDLLLCLCSKCREIRVQATTNIRQLMASLDKEKGDHQQLYLLLGETLESSTSFSTSDAFPYVGGVFAADCAKILSDPTHFMFAKINKFLTSRPSWEVRNLPRKFSRLILLSEPDEDGSYHKEAEWFLQYLLDSLRTPADMEIFRRNNMFERLLSFYSSKSCRVEEKETILRILLRAAAVGGSTTLITRCGVVSWVSMMIDGGERKTRVLKRLAERVWEGCDRERYEEWSAGTLGAMVKGIVEAAA